MDKALDPPLIPVEARSETDDDLRDAIQAYRNEVARLKTIGLNQYGEPAEARETSVDRLRAMDEALERTRDYIRTAMRPISVKEACSETSWDRAQRSGLQHALNAINAEFAKVPAADLAVTAPQEQESTPVIAAGLLTLLKEECEAQHTRAAKAESELKALRAALLVLVGRMEAELPFIRGGDYNKGSADWTKHWAQEIQRLLEAEA